MKIGIMTYWQTLDNYGQVLQCYALQRLLKEMGHEPFIIRYDLNSRPDYVSYSRRLARIVLYPIYSLRRKKRREAQQAKALLEKRRGFSDFRKKHFHFSDRVYANLMELRRDAPKADCYIAGSDQLWGQLLSDPENEAFFLSFGETSTKRIAFAVSYGMKEYPYELRECLRQNLCRFSYISCRERDGVDICESVGINAEHIADPTLLCKPSLYDSLMEPVSQGTPYLFLYSINIASPEEIKFNELKQFADKQGLRILVTVGSGRIEGQNIYDGVEYCYANIGQWLTNIKNASLVVTASFHGVAFCILFHRPFVYVPLTGRMAASNNRVLELLYDLDGLTHVLDYNTSYEQLYSTSFDWYRMGEKLKQLRIDGLTFLEKALNS